MVKIKKYMTLVMVACLVIPVALLMTACFGGSIPNCSECRSTDCAVCGPKFAVGGEWSQFDFPTDTIWGRWTVVSATGHREDVWIDAILSITPAGVHGHRVGGTPTIPGWVMQHGPAASAQTGAGNDSIWFCADEATIELWGPIVRMFDTLAGQGTKDGKTMELTYRWSETTSVGGVFTTHVRTADLVLEKHGDWRW